MGTISSDSKPLRGSKLHFVSCRSGAMERIIPVGNNSHYRIRSIAQLNEPRSNVNSPVYHIMAPALTSIATVGLPSGLLHRSPQERRFTRTPLGLDGIIQPFRHLVGTGTWDAPQGTFVSSFRVLIPRVSGTGTVHMDLDVFASTACWSIGTNTACKCHLAPAVPVSV